MPRLTVFAGPNGAGKTTLSRALRDAGLPNLDPDAPTVAEPAFDVAPATAGIAARDAALAAGESFALETTLATNRSVEQLREAKAYGYALLLVYVCVADAEAAIERVSLRVMNGGTLVPARDVRRSYGRSLRNLPAALELADEVLVFDNSGPAPRLVTMRESDGSWVPEEGPIPPWFLNSGTNDTA